MHQHAEAVDGAQAARAGLFQQRRFERIINDVANRSVFRQRIERDVERGCAAHARACGVDDKRGVARNFSPVCKQACRKLCRNFAVECTGKRFRTREIAIEDARFFLHRDCLRPERKPALHHPHRAARHLFRQANLSPIAPQGSRPSPLASVLRPSMRSPLNTSRLTAPAIRAASSRSCAIANAASLCGTVTLTPAKPSLRRLLMICAKSSRAAGSGTNAPSIPCSRSQNPCRRGDSECATGKPITPASFVAHLGRMPSSRRPASRGVSGRPRMEK